MARVPAPRGPGPHHVRPDDGGVVDLHRDPGDPPGHLRDLRRRRAPAIRRLPRGHPHPDRRRRRDGRRPAPGRDDERRGVPRRRRRPEPAPAPSGPALPRRVDRRPRRRAGARGGRQGRAARAERGAVRERRHGLRRDPGARRGGRHRHRPDERARPAQLPARGDRPRGLVRLRREEARGVHGPRATLHGPPGRGDGRVPRRGRRGLRLRQLDTRRGGHSAATSGPSRSPASCPPTSGRCSVRARGPSGGPRSRATPPTSRPPTPRSSSLFPEDDALARWITKAQERVAFQGLPARICWLGYGERDLAGRGVQRPGRARRRSPRPS